ncbi:MAG: IS5 family transposase, partial [Cyanobacteria bacterium P01_D01_bin.6]
MYRRPSPGQLSFADFYLPFGGQLSGDNRWVKLAELVPWEEFDATYAEQLSPSQGAPAKSFRLALGALIIKEKLGLSDEETVHQVRENPYLQYFLGFHEYRDEAPFEASMMTHFRKRLSGELLSAVNQRVVAAVLVETVGDSPAPEEEDNPNGGGGPGAKTAESLEAEPSDDEPEVPHQGRLLLDATVAPADIRYPTDLDLLHQARASSERILDRLYQTMATPPAKKPRTYRQKARRTYLTVAKQRRPSARVRRKAVGQQLRYLRRNLKHIDTLLATGASLSDLTPYWYRRLLVIHEVYRQQWQMYQQRQRRIDHRIVSLSQPHVRPIVRGKAGTPVEFGAKIALSCVSGYALLDRLDWQAFNESTDLVEQVERYRERFGCYPVSVHVDQLYRTRDNRAWCQAHGIRLSGPPLGRPKALEKTALTTQAREDAAIRNGVEGKFGQAKRRFGLARIKAKLATTAETSIAMTVLVMNLEQRLRALILFFGRLVLSLGGG